MAYITRKAFERWELRESVGTDRGPRSRTLASFDQLTDEVLAQAAARASRPFDPEEVRGAARRAAVPVGLPKAERSARALAAELAQGATISPGLAGVLAGLLSQGTTAPVSAAAQAAAQWADATPREHADALHDLLLLADALPAPRARTDAPSFPRLQSTPVPA